MAVTAFQDFPLAERDLPGNDIDWVKSHLAKYYAKMGDTAPWDHDD